MTRALRALLWLVLAALLTAADPSDETARGDVAWARGDAAEALVMWSLGLERAQVAGDLVGSLDLWLRLGTLHREAGRIAEAERAVASAEALAVRTGRPADPPRAALAAGMLALDQGDLRRAERKFRDAFEAFRAASEPSAAAAAALDLGLVHLAAGRLPEAELAFDASRRVYHALGDALGEADALTDLGISARRRLALGDARRALEAAIALYRDADHAVGEADALTNLGLVLVAQGDVQTARRVYEAALARARARADLPRQARVLLDLGAMEHRAGDRAAAREAYRASEEAFVAAGRPRDALSAALDQAALDADPDALDAVVKRALDLSDRQIAAMALVDLAALTWRTDAGRAKKALVRARPIVEALELGALAWRIDYLDGLMALAEGRRADAIPRLKAAVDQIDARRGALGTDDARVLVLDHEEVYRTLVDALVADGDTAGAFAIAERLQLVDLPAPPLPTSAAERTWSTMLSEQHWLEDQIAGTADADPDKAQALRERLAALRVEFAQAVDQLRATNPDFDELVRVDPDDLQAIQDDLDPHVAVLQPVVLDDRVVLLVYRHDRAVVHEVFIDRRDLERQVLALAHHLQAGNTFEPRWVRQTAESLGATLIGPALPDLEGVDTLVVATTGVLKQLSFAMLRVERRWLVDRLAVVSVTHVGSLRRRGATEARFQVDGPGLLVVGDPDGTLAGAAAEARAIAARFPGATLLVGPEATRARVLDAARSHRSVHFATHAVIDTSRPDQSYLVLAGEHLGYAEVPGLAPWLADARLVVLSACESGLSVQSDPSQPVLVSLGGLAAQFRRAGVETMVGTLWKVDDEGTRRLMDAFYGGLADGKDVARSLQGAQQQLLADARYGHPWYWAGFTVVGDWR